MPYYVGLDVSVKSVAICVVDGDGAIIARGDVSTDPDRIATFLSNHAPNAERVVHESGILAIWLTRELLRRGVPIICIDARLAHKALSGRINKSDRGDAEGLAHLARTGWFNQVHIRSEASERIRVLIGTRERLIRMRKDLEGHVRGVLKVFGVCMGAVGRSKMRQGFRDLLAKAGAVDPAISVMVEMFNPIHKALCAATPAFATYVREVLIPEIARGTAVILDNLATHRNNEAAQTLRDHGCWFLNLPPYSPDLNPIEQAFSKLKAHLRRIGARSFTAVFEAIGEICDLYDPEECWNYFKTAGYVSI